MQRKIESDITVLTIFNSVHKSVMWAHFENNIERKLQRSKQQIYMTIKSRTFDDMYVGVGST